MRRLVSAGGVFISDSEGVHLEYVCDSEADVADLPTGQDGDPSGPRPGSTAYCADTGRTYILTPGRMWVFRKRKDDYS